MTNGMIYVAAMGKVTTLVIALVLIVAAAILSWVISAARQRKVFETTVGSAEVKSREILDEALKEAALIDGCTPGQALRKVILPLMRSSFVQCLFLSVTRCFVVYDVNLSLTNGEPYGSSELAAMHVYQTAFKHQQFGTGQAEALILFIICAIVGVTQVYVGKKGEVEA